MYNCTTIETTGTFSVTRTRKKGVEATSLTLTEQIITDLLCISYIYSKGISHHITG